MYSTTVTSQKQGPGAQIRWDVGGGGNTPKISNIAQKSAQK